MELVNLSIIVVYLIISFLYIGCQTTNGPDIVFVLDGSGSIGAANFIKIKNFVKSVVKSYKVSLDDTRIGLIKYSTAVQTVFKLNTYKTADEVVKAVDKMAYTGGGTNTHLALAELLNAFTEVHTLLCCTAICHFHIVE